MDRFLIPQCKYCSNQAYGCESKCLAYIDYIQKREAQKLIKKEQEDEARAERIPILFEMRP